MSTVAEIQDAIQKLTKEEKAALTTWLESEEERSLSPKEEAALLARLDQAARDLDAGKGVPKENVRAMVGKWASR